MKTIYALIALSGLGATSSAAGPKGFDRIVIDADFPGAYQVEVADVNGDKRPDVVAVGGGTCAWYENPTWKKRIVTGPKQTPGIISSATADLDGDGKAEIAIAYEFEMNDPKKGKLLLAVQGKGPDDPWGVTTVTERENLATPVGNTIGGALGDARASVARAVSPPRPLGNLGSIHRLRWGWIIGGPVVRPGSVSFVKKLELVVAPIFGPSATPPAFDQEPARLTILDTGSDPKSGRWAARVIGGAPVTHAIDVIDHGAGGPLGILEASNRGVTYYRLAAIGGAPLFMPRVLTPGAPGNAPKKGVSEVHAGKLRDGRRFLTTVEPWHGTEVAVYLSDSVHPLSLAPRIGPRDVIDTTLKEGHALWVADVDGDGDDEIFAGYRGPGTSVLMYDYNGKTWDRTVIDRDIAAQDLRGGDLDGDGTPDVVAVGGKTHNVVWYRPVRKPG